VPRPRFFKLPADRRHRILEVAARHFGERGYRDASLNQILEECDVSKGAAYYYFDGKADLFGAVVEHVFAETIEEAGLAMQKLDRKSFWPMMLGLQQRFLERARREPWIEGLARAIWMLSDEERRSPEMAAVVELTVSWLTALFRRGQAVGAVRDDLPAELLSDLVASVDQAADRWLGRNWERLQPAQRTTISDALLQALRRLLQPPRKRS